MRHYTRKEPRNNCSDGHSVSQRLVVLKYTIGLCVHALKMAMRAPQDAQSDISRFYQALQVAVAALLASSPGRTSTYMLSLIHI